MTRNNTNSKIDVDDELAECISDMQKSNSSAKSEFDKITEYDIIKFKELKGDEWVHNKAIVKDTDPCTPDDAVVVDHNGRDIVIAEYQFIEIV